MARQRHRQTGGKVAARQAELEAELERLSQYGKPAKKSPGAAPVAKVKKSGEKSDEAAKKNDEAREPITREPIAKEPIAKAA